MISFSIFVSYYRKGGKKFTGAFDAIDVTQQSHVLRRVTEVFACAHGQLMLSPLTSTTDRHLVYQINR